MTSPESFTTINLAVARKLASAGIPIFPALITRNAATGGLDKVPAISGWRANASTDPKQIDAWWCEFPAAVPEIELGRAGLLVIDLDRHPGAPEASQRSKRFVMASRFRQRR